MFWIDLYVVNTFKEQTAWSVASVSISRVELFMDAELKQVHMVDFSEI